ncbi:hypothetical protein [Polyangium aurulentum]|uniref:hypothetical protein n=1 Tax=Polyangium aurulentum TaxID=2567896 RepID=UPI0010AE6E50|nr:hypothetical protein [Polyangium aurulentum]UQA57739.1 hypothetical protein E8A73_041735 [Polyangium aurulentum]
MTRALCFSTALASALFSISTAPAAAESPPPAATADLGPEPRTHLFSGSVGLIPSYLGEAVGFSSGAADSYASPELPLLVGLSGDYLYSFGFFRMGLGLRYSHTWDLSVRGGLPGESTFAHELASVALLSFGGTTRGVDIAATLGLGVGRAWLPNFFLDLFPPSWGSYGELSVSVAVPVHRDTDLYMRAGLNVAVFRGNLHEEGDLGRRPDAWFVRAYLPHEIGFRKRF